MRPVGRRRRTRLDLPPLMYSRRGRYFYGRQQLALGPHFPEALRKYAELHAHAVVGPATFNDAATAWQRDELKSKAPKTQKEYSRQLATLVKVFGPVPLDTIEPGDVEQFLVERGRTVAATREKALLSLIFNFARRTRLTRVGNPCAGIKGKKAKRDRYVTDAEVRTVLDAADPVLRDFLELCYYTGADARVVARLTRQDVRDGALWVQRTKTGAKVRVDLAGPLQALVARLTSYTVGSLRLIRDEHGQSVTYEAIYKRFRRVCDADWSPRDLRAKAASDIPEQRDAQRLLGHASEQTTAIYRRARIGERATPVMKEIGGGKKSTP
jgi:integrase